jgi:hypothetical protein
MISTLVVAASAVVVAVGVSAKAAGACSNDHNGWQPMGQIAAGPGANQGSDFSHRTRFADLNGDGRADYIQLPVGGGIRAWLNKGADVPGGGGWTYAGRIGSAADPPQRVRFADVDGDGKADYLVVGDDGEVDAFLNRGGDRYNENGATSGWQAHPQFARGGTGATDASQVFFADMNGDGKADYVLSHPGGGALDVWFNKGGDSPGVDGWEPHPGFAGGALDQPDNTLRLANVNCDPKADYLVLNSTGKLAVWINNGGDHNGVDGFTFDGFSAAGTGDPDVQFADIDGDGRADYHPDPEVMLARTATPKRRPRSACPAAGSRRRAAVPPAATAAGPTAVVFTVSRTTTRCWLTCRPSSASACGVNSAAGTSATAAIGTAVASNWSTPLSPAAQDAVTAGGKTAKPTVRAALTTSPSRLVFQILRAPSMTRQPPPMSAAAWVSNSLIRRHSSSLP